MQSLIRVSLVADNNADARKLKRLFQQFPEFTVVNTFAAERNEPGAVDVRVVHGEQATQHALLAGVTEPTLYLVPHGGLQSDHIRTRSAVLPLDAPAAQIRAAAMAVAAGLQITRKNDSDATENELGFSFLEPLTDRELHILNLVADGLSNPEISRRLDISRNTVKFHVSSIISKLGATSRTEAVTIGVKRGLVIL